MIRTSNPMLNERTFADFQDAPIASAERMTLRGTLIKSMAMLLLVMAAAGWTWNLARSGSATVMPYLMGGMFGGLILCLATSFKPEWSALTAPLYAIAEGLVLGALSAILETRYKGIAFQAVGLTFGTMFVMLSAYLSGWLRATERFRMVVIAATGGICLFYLVSLIVSLFGVSLPMFQQGSPLAIGIGLFVAAVAALNLVLDFDFIEQGSAQGAPKHMEWYGAFGLTVTLVWLYLAILRLLANTRRD